MRDRPTGSDDPPKDDTPQSPGGINDRPTKHEPTVADYMRGTSGTSYDDPIWDLPPDQVNAELTRRAKAKVDQAIEREPELRRPAETEPGRGPDLPPEDDDPDDSLAAKLIQRGGDFHDAVQTNFTDLAGYRRLPPTPKPTGQHAGHSPDWSVPSVQPAGHDQPNVGNVATVFLLAAVAAQRARERRKGNNDAG